MITLTHVRGTIAPTGNFKAGILPKLTNALKVSKLADFTKEPISEKGQISFDHSYKLGPDMSELVLNIQKFLNSSEAKKLNLYGTLMVIMETNDDFPKLYKITVEKGAVTYKEGSLAWKNASSGKP